MRILKLKTFSGKKFLLTILCTIIVSVFIGNTIVFIDSLPQWLYSEIVNGMEKDSDVLVKAGNRYKEIYEKMEEKFNKDKELYGDDYPSEEIFLMRLINLFSTNRIMEVYIMSVLIGIVLGTIIYIVAIQNIKGIKMIIELFIAFLLFFILISLLNFGYQTMINELINRMDPTDVIYDTYIYDLESNNILIPYTLVAIAIYLVNLVRQKIIANKLNKQLHNN